MNAYPETHPGTGETLPLRGFRPRTGTTLGSNRSHVFHTCTLLVAAFSTLIILAAHKNSCLVKHQDPRHQHLRSPILLQFRQHPIYRVMDMSPRTLDDIFRPQWLSFCTIWSSDVLYKYFSQRTYDSISVPNMHPGIGRSDKYLLYHLVALAEHVYALRRIWIHIHLSTDYSAQSRYPLSQVHLLTIQIDGVFT